jgi:hypothetical protein
LGKVDVSPLQAKQLALTQASKSYKEYKRPFPQAQAVDQRLYFRRR